MRRRISAPSTTCRRIIVDLGSASADRACCRISAGVRTLPMSCISPARPNSRSSVPSMPSAARLRHRQNRHVHHVRERVVVVFLERGQRQQGGAVLRDRLRRAARSGSWRPWDRACPRAGRHPTAPRPRSRPRRRAAGSWRRRRPTSPRARRSECARRGSAAGGRARSSAIRGRRAGAAWPGRRSGWPIVWTSSDSSSGVTPRSKAMRSMPSRFRRRMQLAEVSRLRGIGRSPTTMSCPTMPTAMLGSSAEQLRARLDERSERPGDERMTGRIELRARGRPRRSGGRTRRPHATGGRRSITGSLLPAAGRRGRQLASAAARRTPREPVVLAVFEDGIGGGGRSPAARAPRRRGCGRCASAPTIRPR